MLMDIRMHGILSDKEAATEDFDINDSRGPVYYLERTCAF